MPTLIFWVLVLFVALSYFGVSAETIINSPAVRENIAYLFSLISRWFH